MKITLILFFILCFVLDCFSQTQTDFATSKWCHKNVNDGFEFYKNEKRAILKYVTQDGSRCSGTLINRLVDKNTLGVTRLATERVFGHLKSSLPMKLKMLKPR